MSHNSSSNDVTFPIDGELALRWLTDMVAIDSVNPSLVPGGAGEAVIATYLADVLRSLGMETYVQEAAPGRPNVIGVLRGRQTGRPGARSLMLVSHTDTVSKAGMDIEPLAAKLEGDRVYGRGTVDMKGGIASILAALHALVSSGTQLNGNLIFAGVADEEYASIGVEHLVGPGGWRADAGVITEPTGLDLVVAHKGFAWINADVHGRAAHGSRFEDGVDAITNAGRLLVAYDQYQADVLAGVPTGLTTRPSVHASLIEGGRELSTYPEACRVSFERRTIPGETRATVERELAGLLADCARRYPDFRADAEIFFYREAYEISQDETIVRLLAAATERVTGSPAQYGAASGWMDSAVMGAAGIPTVIFGPSGDGAHAAVEWVSLASVIDAAQVLAQLAAGFCGLARRD